MLEVRKVSFDASKSEWLLEVHEPIPPVGTYCVRFYGKEDDSPEDVRLGAQLAMYKRFGVRNFKWEAH